MLQLKNFFSLVKKTPVFNNTVMLILLTYPALLLTVRGSMGVLFGVMLIISAVHLFRIRKILSMPHWDSHSIAFALTMASPVVAIFLSQASHGKFDSPSYDWASRFLLAIPIFLALRQTDIRTITVLQYGIPLGALVGLAMLEIHPFDWGGRHTTSNFFNLIHFSDTALILGFLSLFSINWERKDHPLVLALKLCGFMAGMYMSIQSGERGSWAAMPLLMLLWVAAHSKKNLWLKFGIAIPILAATAWLSYSMLEVVHTRIDTIFSDITQYAQGNRDTSVGVRVQLYLAAIHLFSAHPIFGIGPGEFGHSISILADRSVVTPLAGQMGTAEVHNEILHKCAETGIFGLLSILSIYLVPIFILWRSIKSAAISIRIASFMGICLVFGFFIFGLTVETFNLKMTATFFAFTLAVLMAAAMHHEAPETITSLKKIESGLPNNLISPSQLSRVGHYARISFAPLVAVPALTIAIIALNNNQFSHAQLDKINIQIENLSVSLLSTQDELKKIQSDITQKNTMLNEENKKEEAQISILIQSVNALQVKMKIFPTLEEQLRQPTSTVTPSTGK